MKKNSRKNKKSFPKSKFISILSVNSKPNSERKNSQKDFNNSKFEIPEMFKLHAKSPEYALGNYKPPKLKTFAELLNEASLEQENNSYVPIHFPGLSIINQKFVDGHANLSSYNSKNDSILIHENILETKKESHINNTSIDLDENEFSFSNSNKNIFLIDNIEKEKPFNIYKNKRYYSFRLNYHYLICGIDTMKNLINFIRDTFVPHFIKSYLIVSDYINIYVYIKLIIQEAYNIEIKKETLKFLGVEPLLSFSDEYEDLLIMCRKYKNFFTNMKINIEKGNKSVNYLGSKHKIDNKDKSKEKVKNEIKNESDIFEPPLEPKRNIWLYGPKSINKKVALKNYSEPLYYKSLDDNWNNYDNQKTVVVDLTKANDPKICLIINKIIEKNKFPNIKGNKLSYINIKTIIFIADKSIDEFFKKEEHMIHKMGNVCEKLLMDNLEDGTWIAEGLKNIRFFLKFLRRYNRKIQNENTK